jgi:hypothetical protein
MRKSVYYFTLGIPALRTNPICKALNARYAQSWKNMEDRYGAYHAMMIECRRKVEAGFEYGVNGEPKKAMPRYRGAAAYSTTEESGQVSELFGVGD